MPDGTAAGGAGRRGPRRGAGAGPAQPAGSHQVGPTSLHLVDIARPRELMVRLWYPATRSGPAARYMPSTQAALLVEQLNAGTGADFPAGLLTFPTHSRQDAPAARGPRRPVLVFSPGLGTNAVLYTGICEELASRGYLVADLRFVLDRLTALAAGHSPDAGHRRLPGRRIRALAGQPDRGPCRRRRPALRHRRGPGRQAARRRRPGPAVADGRQPDPPLRRGPRLVRLLRDRLRGPRRYPVVDGTEHNDFSDVTVFKETIDLGALFAIGPIDGDRALLIQRRYLTAWFDHNLRGRPNPLLRRESPRFPEVDFQP